MSTPEGAAIPRAHQLREAELSREVGTYVRDLVAGVNLDRPAKGWPALERALVPMVQGLRQRSAAAGADMYLALRSAELAAADAAAAPVAPAMRGAIPADQVAGTARQVGLRRIVQAVADRRPVDRQTVAGNLASSMDRLVRNGGRDTISATGAADPRAVGWARVSGTGAPCAWCAMLISRGGVYGSKQTASQAAGGYRYHDGCSCKAVPVFDPADPYPPGSREIEERWREVTGGASDESQLQRWRRDWNANLDTSDRPSLTADRRARRAARRSDPARTVAAGGTPPPSPIPPGMVPASEVVDVDRRLAERLDPLLAELDQLHGFHPHPVPTRIVKGGKAKLKGGHFSPYERGPMPKRPSRRARKYRDLDYADGQAAYRADLEAVRDRITERQARDPWPEIRVNDRGLDDPEFVTLHELGHRLDWRSTVAAGDARGTFPSRIAVDSYTDRDALLAVRAGRSGPDVTTAAGRFMAAARETPTIADAAAHWRDAGFVSDYFSTPIEVWARAYSQYAARRIGGPALASLRRLQGASGKMKWYQWPDDEFDALEPLVEAVLRDWGALP